MGVLVEIHALVLEGGFIPSVKKKGQPKTGKTSMHPDILYRILTIPPKIGIFMD